MLSVNVVETRGLVRRDDPRCFTTVARVAAPNPLQHFSRVFKNRDTCWYEQSNRDVPHRVTYGRTPVRSSDNVVRWFGNILF